jgi:hypothetical protein
MRLLLALPFLALATACAVSASPTSNDAAPSGDDAGVTDANVVDLPDAVADAPAFDPDAACATAQQVADPKPLPVDIIWMVDNSVSMEPAVAQVKSGINAFASLIGTKALDYRVIMLSLKSKASPIVVAGKTRYPVCVPQPLAGDANCGDGPRFFHSSVDIKSTQPLEQFLGTLGQTTGYQPGDERGGDPWKLHLRPEATKTIVIVTDDNSRFSATDFETFPGGQNPNNSLLLPPGILDPSWGGLFKGYVFAGVYGWGSAQNANVTCTYPNSTVPPSSGPTYTDLVTKTKGPRAKICDGANAWTPFFDAVAQAVIDNSKIACEMPIPKPSNAQTIDPTKVNVSLDDGNKLTPLTKTSSANTCGTNTDWYYDDDKNPTKVVLCPAACALAQTYVGPSKKGGVRVLFGCATVVR